MSAREKSCLCGAQKLDRVYVVFMLLIVYFAAMVGIANATNVGDGGAFQPMYFLELKDVHNTFGKLELRTQNLRFKKTAIFDSAAIPTFRIVKPDEQGGWLLYGYEHQDLGKDSAQWSVVRFFSPDGYTFTHGERLYTEKGSYWNAHTAMAWNEDNGSMLLLKTRLKSTDIGIGVWAYSSANGDEWQALSSSPVYYDHDGIGLLWNSARKEWVAYQTTYQAWPKRNADNLGSATRRVLHLRTSTDGIVWSPSTPAAFPFNLPPAARALSLLNRLPVSQLITPNNDDPPDMEFYRMTPFRYGDRYAAIVLNYAPSPQNVNPVTMYAGHGPWLSAEWWMSDDGISWRRPYQGQDALGEAPMTPYHPPIALDKEHLFVIGRDLYSFQRDRLAGIYSKANGEFSTATFTMPDKPLSLNVAAVDRTVPRPGNFAPERQNYVMVELQTPDGKTIKGYEREKAAFHNIDSLGLPLVWSGKDGTELAGRDVRLRIFFRDATVYTLYSGIIE